MESQRRSLLPLSNLGTPALALIVAATFAGALYWPSYESPRPQLQPLAWESTNLVATAEALLTQDPLEIAYARAKEIGMPAGDEVAHAGPAVGNQFHIQTAPELAAEFSQGLDASAQRSTALGAEAPKTLVLVASLRSGSWPEDRERRVRTRYALATAMSEAGLHARATRELRFFGAEFGSRFGIVPFDWFDASSWFDQIESKDAGQRTQYDHVLCLWLDEALIDDQPMRRIYQLLESIVPRADPRVSLCVVGPSGSDGLLSMMRDADDLDASPQSFQLPAWAPLTVVSPMATVTFRADHAGEQLTQSEIIEDKLIQGFESGAARSMRLVRSIGQDDLLAELLLLELAERIPALMPLSGSSAEEQPTTKFPPSDLLSEHVVLHSLAAVLHKLGFYPRRMPVRVALVLEQDTKYGRRWLRTMERARERLVPSHPLLATIEFEPVPYSSVIDGNTPDAGKGDARKDADGAVQPRDIGPSQVDYLVRMDRVLAQGRPLAAIGVLGTDVYDRLMILQALRHSFPGAVFFSTDMDTRLLDANRLPYTRNLVIASHFKLGANDEPIQFRDSYQYSTHFAIHTLLGWDLANWSARATDGPAWGRKRAHLFEIGRGIEVELNTDGMHTSEVGKQGESLEPDDAPDAEIADLGSRFMLTRMSRTLFGEVQAKEGRGDSSPRIANTDAGKTAATLPKANYAWLGVSSMLVLGVFLLIGLRPGTLITQSYRQRAINILRAFVLPIAIACFALLWSARQVDQMAREYPAEPLDPFLGVSVWPTVLLRVIGVLFCVLSIAVVRHRLLAAYRSVGTEFALNDCGSAPPFSRFARWLLGVPGSADTTLLSADDAWCALGPWLSKWSWLLGRLVLYVAFCLAIVTPFFRFSSPGSPVRGEFGYLIERASLLINIWSFLALICYVLESSFLADRIVHRLVDLTATSLPKATLEKESQRSGLSPTQAAQRVRIRLTQRITAVADQMIYLPAIAVGLMVFSRASILDNWSWPAVLVGTQAAFFLLLFLCVLNTNGVARAERAKVLRFIHEERLIHAGDATQRDRLELLRTEIEGLRGGAFVPLIEHPLVRAALLPLIAWGTAGLVDQGMLTSLLQKL